jgi:hypothetical protein
MVVVVIRSWQLIHQISRSLNLIFGCPAPPNPPMSVGQGLGMRAKPPFSGAKIEPWHETREWSHPHPTSYFRFFSLETNPNPPNPNKATRELGSGMDWDCSVPLTLNWKGPPSGIELQVPP